MTRKSGLRFLRDRRGSVAVEAALLFPFLVLLLNGAYELSNFVTAVNKLDRASQTLCQLVSRAPGIAEADIADHVPFAAASNVARPFNLFAEGRIIVSLIADRGDGDGPVILWRRESGRGVRGGSHLGPVGGSPVLPKGLVEAGQSVFAVEISYFYTPRVWKALAGSARDVSREIYLITYEMPRTAPTPQ